MQTVETLNEGLKRAYTLTIAAGELDRRVDTELKRVAPQVKMPGFRPGKVPANLVRKMHGPALMQDALNSSIQEGVQGLLAERQLRPAIQPSVNLDESYEPGGDAEVKVELEVLPDVPRPVIDGLRLERLTAAVPDTAVDAQLRRFADQQKRWDDAEGDRAAAIGDLVTVDFLGKTADGVAFEGGTGEDMAVELGSGRLIPGFEDQLVGVTAGEDRVLNVTFPDDYPAKDLAGRPATFEVTAKSVKVAGDTRIDDELATSLGLESLEQLTGLVKGQIEQEHNGLTRTHMKRKLLDHLAADHEFPVPPSMVTAEFDQIWAQLQHEATHEPDPEAALQEMETERDEYRQIAERRVRLGLLLSEIGQANGVEITQQEVNRLISQAAQRYPREQQQQFIQYIQQEPMAAAQLRAPLYEDKVVDWLFERAEISDREVTREELEAAIESEEGFSTGTHHHDHDNHKPKAARRAKAAADKGQPADEGKKPARKASARKVSDANVEPAAPGQELVPAEPVKKAATRKAPAKKAAEQEPVTDAATAEAPATPPPAEQPEA